MTDESDHVRLILIEQQMKELGAQVEMQTLATRELVDAWQSAKTVLGFIQLLAKVGAACAALWLMAKGLLQIGTIK